MNVGFGLDRCSPVAATGRSSMVPPGNSVSAPVPERGLPPTPVRTIRARALLAISDTGTATPTRAKSPWRRELSHACPVAVERRQPRLDEQLVGFQRSRQVADEEVLAATARRPRAPTRLSWRPGGDAGSSRRDRRVPDYRQRPARADRWMADPGDGFLAADGSAPARIALMVTWRSHRSPCRRPGRA